MDVFKSQIVDKIDETSKIQTVQQHFAVLAQLASRISAIMKFGAETGDGPFAKVKGLIMCLINRLPAEAPSEASHTSCRDEATSKATEKEDLEADTKHSYKVACDTCAKDNTVIAAGEITVAGKFHRETVVRRVVPNIGIDSFIDDLSCVDSKGLIYKDCEVLFHVNKQSPDAAEGMHVDKDDLQAGNGDLWWSCSDGERQVTDPRKIHTAVTHAMLSRRHTAAAQKQAAPRQPATAINQTSNARETRRKRGRGKRERKKG